MSIDPRRTQPFPTCTCINKECRCSRWPDYVNRWGLPVAGGEETYDDKVLATGPIAYWPQSETAGVTAHCLVNPLQDGTYTGVTLANDNTGPFGTPAPFYDGANDYNNVNTATLQAAWNAGGAEWSIMTWWMVFNVAVWTDATLRRIVTFIDTAADQAYIGKTAVNNLMYAGYWAGGGVAHGHTEGGLVTVDWNCSVVTRSEAADEIRYYRNGAWLATDVAIGNWASAGAWATMAIGASSTVPQQVWHGWLGPVGLWNRPLTPAEITALANP